MQPDDYSRLKSDIQLNGFDSKNPIYTYQGDILDGWNRFNACKELGVIPTYAEFIGSDTDAISFVMRTNKRRNLNSSQWAVIAVEAEELVAVIRERVESERRVKQKENAANQHTEPCDNKLTQPSTNAVKQTGQLIATPFTKPFDNPRRGFIEIDNEPIVDQKGRDIPRVVVNTKKEGIKVLDPVQSAAIRTNQILADTFNTNRTYINDATRLRQDRPELLEQVKRGEITIPEARKMEKKAVVIEKEDAYRDEIKAVNSFDVDIYNTDKKFNIIYADPAWSYWEGGEKNQSLHYQTMSIDQICNIPVKNIADDNCILFIWVTYPILIEALKVIEAWGFKYSTCGFVWVKKNKNADSWFFGNGAWTRANSELCLIATKGTTTRMSASISQVLDDRIMDHSQKPERVRKLITDLVGELPRVELFSRNENNDGWFNWGNKI